MAERPTEAEGGAIPIEPSLGRDEALRETTFERSEAERTPRRTSPSIARLGTSPSIAVIIVNWNAREELTACLLSLASQTDRDFETIVVDNGSRGGTQFLEQFPWVTVVQTGANLGFAEGCNQGIAKTSAEWVATLNNDTVVDPRWVATLRQAARQAPENVGMFQSCMVFQSDETRLNSTGLLLFSDGSAEDRDFDKPIGPASEEVFCPTAGAALYRRSMLEATRLPSGYFDREFFMYCEDVDLGWRCRLAGYESRYVEDAVVAHAFQGSSKKRERGFVGLHLRRNRLRTILKNASYRFLVQALPRTAWDIATAVFSVGPQVLPSFAVAIRDGLMQRRLITRLAKVSPSTLERRWATKRAS